MYESNYDWSIHKKLDEARTVYVIPARANCKPLRQLEIYAELFKSGRTVCLSSLPTVEMTRDMIDKMRDITLVEAAASICNIF